MQLEDYFDFLSPDDIRIKGHRIGIESVLYEYIYRSRTPEEIADVFPSLNLEQILATLLYYQRNKAQIDAYLAAWIDYGERMRAEQARNPTPAMLRLRRLKAEREAAKRASLELQPA
ncbi:MAG: hypothetical protein CVU38_17285 [Chloroflexi bacterium HGW-Chloroflexi-1]|nr:MAG: hypothetical protein CVU38_17285 [Chloroflexi bacterium HGW-Chloroflexi-1]